MVDRRDRAQGRLLDSLYGLGGIAERWVDPVVNCCPSERLSGVHRPRPEEYWPADALELAEHLLDSGPPS